MIKIIKDNLNYFINYKIIVEKNETKIIFAELEQKSYLIRFQLRDDYSNINYFYYSLFFK